MPLTAQFTEELKLPVPPTTAKQESVCPRGTLSVLQEADTDVIVGGTDTVTWNEPDLVGSCVEVAVIVAVPDVPGVKTPALLMVPAPVGETAHETALLKFPVPTTEALQVDVWEVSIADGLQLTDTLVIAVDAVMVILVLPETEGNCFDVAVMVTVPGAAGVNRPVALIFPAAAGLTDQLIPCGPNPGAVASHCDVCVVRMDDGEQVTKTGIFCPGRRHPGKGRNRRTRAKNESRIAPGRKDMRSK